ncbi:MAG: hypothetical protein B7Y48_05245 [Methylophilales bacterium 28-44-11]|nr:MAG: hypothetical protein B7Y48_05245 [Methylophilales bacterium 28-44-11]
MSRNLSESPTHLASVFIAALWLLSSGSLSAMEFTTGVFLPVSINYDSNIQMTNTDEESVTFYNVNPRLTVLGSDGINTINFIGSVLFQRSSDEVISEDRKDPSLGLGWVRSFERGEFSLSTNYNKNSSRVTERRATGLIFNDGSVISRSYDAGIKYLISQKLNLSSGLNYQQTRFTGAGLNDFNSKTFNSKLDYLYSEKLTPFVQFSISRFENETNTVTNVFANNLLANNTNSSGKSISKNLLGGFTYTTSPQLFYSVAYGVNHISSVGNGWIGNASINYTIDEQSTLVGTVARNVAPSGLGGFLKTDNLVLNYVYDINQKNHVGADASWTITRDANNSDYKQLGANYTYDLNEDWGLRTYAQYRTLKASTNINADAYLIGVSLSFNNPNLF